MPSYPINITRTLSRKIAVITGGAASLGYEIADSFLSRGLQMAYILDANSDLANKAIQNLTAKYGEQRVNFGNCNVTTVLSTVTKKMFEAFNVDIFINNADLLTGNETKKIIDRNITGTIEWGLTFYEHMRQDTGGRKGTIINLASIYGFRVDQYLPIYQATKFAVVGFSRSLGHPTNFEKTGVRVLALCPGFNDTRKKEEPRIWDQTESEQFLNHVKALQCPKPGLVGDSTVEVYETADTGTAWLINNKSSTVELLNV